MFDLPIILIQVYGISYNVKFWIPVHAVLEIRIRNWLAVFEDKIFYRVVLIMRGIMINIFQDRKGFDDNLWQADPSPYH